MASQQPTSSGGSKRPKLFSRLLSWRQTSTSQSNNRPRMIIQPEESGSVRRTSPVDLNLGSEEFTHVAQCIKRNGCVKNRKNADYIYVHPTHSTDSAPDQLLSPPEKDEVGALRSLAAELHAALRRSEEENTVLKARLQTLDDLGLMRSCEPSNKLDQLIDDLREIASSNSPTQSPYSPHRNVRYLGNVLQRRQAELRQLQSELLQTQTELLFAHVELEEVRKCLRRLHQRLLYAEEELTAAKEGLVQASLSKQRLMQELQTTRGLLMRCWSRVRLLEQQQLQQDERQHQQ